MIFVYARILQNKTKEAIQGKIGENPLPTLLLHSPNLLEKKQTKYRSVYQDFIDLKKSHVSVPKQALEEVGEDENLTQEINILHNKINAVAIKVKRN